MSFNFGNIKTPKKEALITDPVEIFQKNKGKISDKSINDLWLGQGDALRDWNNNRNKNDVAIVLNTGAGKTLIGLLIAQSLVNETRGKVIYACASIQLIEQTREKAEGYGIPVTTYFKGNYSNDLFQKGQAVCLTTYQAIFNGKSVFRREDIEAIIFDDAHTAENMIKNHFSFEIDRKSNLELYDEITNLFRPYYQKIGKATSFKELCEGENRGVELLPPSIINNNFSEINRLITQSNAPQTGGNTFSWEHLKDHLDLCAYFISTGSIQITPAFIPVGNLPYFKNHVRRVYLTATMLGEDSFIKTFGREVDHIVKPKTTAGECERLILFPGHRHGYEHEKSNTKTLIEHKKALILTPSNYQATNWEDIGSLPKRSEAVKAIATFKNADNNQKLILAGRYDGIDLPGDTCRYMVLDGLPSGTSLFDKYLWESLNLSHTLRSVIGCRVVQSLGRISRGMSDYGVVLITDKAYVNWLLIPKNLASLPDFVQKQIQLGIQVTEQTAKPEQMSEASDTFMARDPQWQSFYDNFMEECDVETNDIDVKTLHTFAKAEVKFSKYYWERDYAKAAKVISSVLDDAFEFSSGLGAWYCFWLGYCLELLGDENFHNFYQRAYGASRSIPKHLSPLQDSSDNPYSPQVSNVVSEFIYSGGSLIVAPSNIVNNLSFLKGGSTNQVEEAIRFLGQYLGLDSTRPDKEQNIGPDNLWVLDGIALVIETKSGKNENVEYSKKYVGQLAQHITWVEENYDPKELTPAFVGPAIGASASASPSDEMMVIELTTLKELSEKLSSAYDDIASIAIPITLHQTIEEVFTQRELLWPDLIHSLNLRPLKSL